MINKAKKIDRETLLKLLVNALSQNLGSVRLLKGINPCLVNYNGKEYYFYIKNLSPAQLSNDNPDVWRIQLPIKKEFNIIKKSSNPFLLLGYDGDNDVYTSWNPFWIKQRLNVGKSISLYSRLSLQQEVASKQVAISKELNHNGIVYCFPRKSLPDYIKNIHQYFPKESIYIPIGSRIESKKRMEINKDKALKLFDTFASSSNFDVYNDYMHNEAQSRKGTLFSSVTAENYISSIKYVFRKNLFEINKSLFLRYQYLDDYSNAIETLLEIEDINAFNRASHNTLRSALEQYLRMMKKNHPEYVREKSMFKEEKTKITKLPSSLIEKLRPLMNLPEPETYQALTILSDYYGNTYNDVMGFNDWVKLLEKTKWDVSPQKGNIRKKAKNNNTKQASSNSKDRADSTTLRITYSSNNRVVCSKSAVQVFEQTIKECYPDLIIEMGIRNGGLDLITREKIPNRPDQRDLGDGYYLTTRSNTGEKARILKRIFNELDIDAKIEIIPSASVENK